MLRNVHFRFPVFLALFFALTPVFPMLTSDARAESLTVFDGLKTVISRGYDVQIAQAYLEAAAQAEELAKSGLRPRVNAYADYTWLRNRPEAIFGGGSSPLGEDHFLRYGVNLRQSITDFGRTRAGMDSARAGALVGEGRLDQARGETAVSFVDSYIALLQAEKTLDAAQQEVKRFQAHVSDARALYDAGEVTKSDILSVEVALADASQKMITARDGRELAASRVNFFVLRPLDSSIQVQDFPSPFTGVPNLEEMVRAAEAGRPELRVLTEQIAVREAELKVKRSDRYPEIYFGGGYSYEENPYRVYDDNWSAVVGVTWDLYTGGARSAQEAKVSRELAAALTERERMKETIFLQVTEAFLKLGSAIERMDVTEKALVQAEENLRLQKARYQEGEASATDVIDAVTALTGAQNNHWRALYDRRRAEAQILFATGADLPAAYGAMNLNRQKDGSAEGKPGE